MIDQSKFEHLYGQCGGVYKTTVLMQKRMRELNRGARKLVEEEAKNPIEIVMSEIEQNKIELIPDNEENREIIRAEVERMTHGQPPSIDVGGTTSEDELERRILSALSKDD
ncbi:MAG: DNA-directed RNA polymerase subunit omega [Planctomycetes bacterium]|jgi:DNA-directed RNA polymerase subunit K/omega|nr:DNA-directed RNA polymerase subunit omega [Planctomycetota bacterium]